MNILTILPFLFLFSLGHAQENRRAMLLIDFGKEPDQQAFWANWEEPLVKNSIQKLFPYTFDLDGVLIKIQSTCVSNFEVTPQTSCGFSTIPQDSITGTPINYVLNDGLKNAGLDQQLTIESLPEGFYDLELFFHQVNSISEQIVKLELSDSRVSNFVLMDDLKPSTGTNYPSVSSFHIPIQVRNSVIPKIKINSKYNNLLLNGLILTQYSYVQMLNENIEIIGTHRPNEAGLTGFLENADLKACTVQHDDNLFYFGYWSKAVDACRYTVEQSTFESDEFKFVRADPFKKWQRYNESTIPAGAVPFTKNNGLVYYPCLVQRDANSVIPGVYIKGLNSSCTINSGSGLEFYSQFDIWLHKNP